MKENEFLHDYEKIFNHASSLKKVVLVSTGRTGSLFFQSLLDGHEQILQIAGFFYFHEFWNKSVCKENLDDFIDEFIWFTTHGLSHISRFKSYYDKLERWDELGEEKNESFEISVDLFKIHIKNIFMKIPFNRRNFFIAIHIAYNLAMDKSIYDCKILFYHIHHIHKLASFSKDFTDFEVVCTVREPRNTIVSGLDHSLIYTKKFPLRETALVYYRILHESGKIQYYTENFYVLNLENLHLRPKEIMQKFAEKYSIDYKESMLKSEFHGKKWWGDAYSIKYLDGFNKNIKKIKWDGKFYFYENIVLEFILVDRLKHYDYPIKSKFNSLIFLPLIFIFILFPLKYEIKEISLCSNKKGNIGNFYLNYYFRVKIFYKFLFRRVRKKIYLPKKLG